MVDTLHPEGTLPLCQLSLLGIGDADAVCAVLWAQRSNETEDEKNIVYLSVNAIDLQHPKVDLSATGVVVEGVQRETNNVYKVSLEFFAEINLEVPSALLPPLLSSLLCVSVLLWILEIACGIRG